MTFNWADYYRLSNSLVENQPVTHDEAALRCAVSRSYYAAFCSARDWAVGHVRLVVSGRGTDHEIVRKHFLNSGNIDRRQIGLWLSRLRDDRNTADYDTSAQVQESMAKKSVQQAKNLLDRLKYPTL